jgi:hypothetical protein
VSHQEADGFPPGVAGKLRTYVYRLIDPRNGETFYVGKGKGNRVFAHIRLERRLEGDELDNKVNRIREIHAAGLRTSSIVMADDRPRWSSRTHRRLCGLTNIARRPNALRLDARRVSRTPPNPLR